MEVLEILGRDSGPYSKSKDLVVFSILRDSKCTDCNELLGKGRYLFMEAGRPLCLRCADLDHLIYLPAGDAALTRRAKKYSSLSAVVVRFSRSRRRYERQGVLVEEKALQYAEEECLEDADQRATRRVREEMRRMEQDHDLVAHMADTILELFPGCPLPEARAIATHTAARSSGRVGRTAAGKALMPDAITAAVIAAIRHNHTCYDQLFMSGCSRIESRDGVRMAVGDVLNRWRSRHHCS
jgi:hypothetical protein